MLSLYFSGIYRGRGQSMKKPKSSVFSRTTSLLGMAAKMAGQELTAKISQAQALKVRVEQAKALVEALSELKGAAMKAGQLLTLELQDWLPPEVTQVLSKLNDSGSFVDHSIMRKVFEDSLAPELKSQIEWNETSPLASASIGQVYRAQYRGHEIVLKIQFPEIDKTIENDIRVLKRLSSVLNFATQKEVEFESVLEEVKEVLIQETNYRLEAQFTERYRTLAANIPEIRIPQVYSEISNERILALSFEKGTRILDWIEKNPSQAARNRVGKILLDLYIREFLDWGLVQTDPNFGNFLYDEDTDQLVVLDFGATREYSAEFRNQYLSLIRLLRANDREGILTYAADLGLLDRRESAEAQQLFIAMVSQSIGLFEDRNQPYDFSDSKFPEEARKHVFDFIRALKYTPPPKAILFLHRKLGGIYHILRKLKAQVDLRDYQAKLFV